MSIDGRFLNYQALELNQELQSGRIQKISQLGKTDFLFLVRANNYNHKLYLSLSTSLARINLTSGNYPSDYTPGGFCMFLRKHFEGSYIKSIKTLNADRILEISVENKNDIGDKVDLYLIMETFSRYTNLIILDQERKIINAFKHISPFDKSERTIINGVAYTLPEDGKIDPLDFQKIQTFFETEKTYKDIVENIQGISPLLANYIVEKANYNHHNMFSIYQEIIESPPSPTISLGQKTQFYYLDIFSDNKKHFKSISALVDYYFLEASSLERVKQIHKYLFNFVKREYKRKKNKLEKLSVDLNQALDSDILRIKGDTLIADQYKIHRGDGSYKGHSYELSSDIEIELDRMLTPIQNANKYYKKYKKQKTAVGYIEEQIKITKTEILYFGDLKNQISSNHTLNDLLEIQDELIQNGYLNRKKTTSKKKKPNYDGYIDEDGITILVGKNNIQNNYLTHKFARKEYWWFHVKGQTGSHVIVCSEEDLSENTIRTAANLSAYYSKSQMSNSVPVDYTKIKNLKKVPGNLGSFVTYTNQKTIYIDPDLEQIQTLKKGN